MDNNNISIKSINDLLKSNFFIPSYQRGYRWTETQVTDLLNDINVFSPKEIPNSNEKTWYCLQPIVVKQKNENEWDVIDGQQRLTTAFLILHYLNQGYIENRQKKLFSLKYETRENSAEYLQKELNGETINDQNIDYHFISSAYKIICDWFKNRGEQFDVNTFESKFNFSTKVIWYETSKGEDSIDIFTRINSGKIPLTNAELIKALFLNCSNFANSDTEKLRLKQLEIASEWDRIEYASQDDSFWYFINKNENNLATRIEYIFNLMYEVAQAEDVEVEERKKLRIKSKEKIEERKKEHQTISERFGNDEYSTFRFFNEKFKAKSEKEINDNWQEIKKYSQTLEEWYNNRELYHKIGYLIAIGTNIKNILKGKEEKSKTEFANWLKQEMESKFKNTNLEEVEYNGKNVREILLLHNIQTILNNENETNRFPFDRYKKESWDVEHIHAIATEVKVKKENQIDWLNNNFIKTYNHHDKNINNQIGQIIKSGNQIDENEFDDIIDYVLGEEDNSIRNLCLLDSGTNRSYKNDSFKVKRKKIIEREIEGTFIPICTKNVFMKYYSANVKDIEVWNENDRTSYLEKIQKVINQYLPQTELAENEQ
ncbi:hypothetical protein pgond44_14013 [Psychroflexus gondwanensis ACAM 44]|jgi:uncharacterized protein with ParB-like and HNH nuclease domain|uniref:GmrSD restriction endonucleases N-terminal domain-containing protein n=1 Tax=Psychroflexus gondwanensis ACAM 44 TaxID=1189619 RepID=N1WM36_9FLAO|nr:DUF262 domain-containing protein [Psychroflexus gondwanensis]EMY80025.1 hypothetical protein pgond44_14013 [Psychroflexus gondwanensis ACAM 44]